jgi:hypothetical protein
VVGIRLFGIVANPLFIAHGAAADLMPVLLLHRVPLPINIAHRVRTWRGRCRAAVTTKRACATTEH